MADRNKTAAQSLVRAHDKLAKQKQTGQDTSRQEIKVVKATELYKKAKKKSE